MNKKITSFVMLGSRINRRHIEIVLTLIALALLVIGIGAPADGGGATGAPVRWPW